MKRTDPVEAALDKLSALRALPDPAAAAGELRAALASRVNLVVAKAAKITAELRLAELAPELAAAFQRLMQNPAKLDKRCEALTQIATALYEIDYLEPELFLQGIRHVQLEASFGPPVDTAARLRAQCALALVRTRHPDALNEVVALLVDREPQARIGAVRALGMLDNDASILLLRLKVLSGDPDPEVIAECFSQLLALAPDRSVPFVARYVDWEDDALAEAAILALGASRQMSAFEILREKYERTVDASLRRTLLLAFAMARLEEATAFLLEVLRTAHPRTAADVISALAAYQSNDRVRQAVEGIVRARGERPLQEAFQTSFPG